MHANGTYSTGQIARICGVSNRMVQMWIDQGKMRGHRLPTTGLKTRTEHRRVERSELERFMRVHGFPWGVDSWSLSLGVDVHGCEQVETLAELGFRLGKGGVNGVVVDWSIGSERTREAGYLFARLSLPALGLAPEDWSGEAACGYAEVWKKPVDPARVAGWVERLRGER